MDTLDELRSVLAEGTLRPGERALALLVDAVFDAPEPERTAAITRLQKLASRSGPTQRKLRKLPDRAVELLGSPQAEVRRLGARLLTPQGGPAATALLRGLADEDAEVREACSRALLSGEVEPAALVPYLRSEWAEVRQAALHAVGLAPGKEAVELWPELQRLLADPLPALRHRAALLLAHLHPLQHLYAETPGLWEALVDVARTSQDDSWRTQALEHLQRLGPRLETEAGPGTRAVLYRLLPALESSQLEESVRGQIALALARLGIREVLPSLVRLLEQPDETFQDRFDEVTGQYRGPRLKCDAAQALGALGKQAPLKAEEVRLLESCVRAGGSLAEAAAEALVDMGLRSPELESSVCAAAAAAAARGWNRAGLLRSLARLRPRRLESLRELVRALGEEEPVGRQARENLWLAARERPECLTLLETLSESDEPEVSRAAQRALWELGVLTEGSRARLAQGLLGSDEVEREEAAAALRRFGTRAQVLLPQLLAGWLSAGAETRMAVLSVLGALCGGGLEPAVRKVLLEALEDGNAQVREVAAAALWDFSGVDAELSAHTRAPGGEGPSGAQVEAGEAGLAALASRRFGLALYETLREQQGNLAFSPLSIFTLLSLCLSGARGHTAAELVRALQWNSSPRHLATALHALLSRLQAEASEQTFIFSSAQGLWFQQGYPLHDEFLASLAASGASAEAVNFASEPEAACSTINHWVQKETHGLIPEIVNIRDIPSTTRLLMANAVYFKARWQHPFPDEATRPAPFRLLDGTQVEVPMMTLYQGTCGYASGPGYQLVTLPYRGSSASLAVLLPDEGLLARCERLLCQGRLEPLFAAREEGLLDLSLPRFSLTRRMLLDEAARQFGLESLLGGDADLSGMTPRREASLGRLLHEATLSVDEKGTEAAAVTIQISILGVPRRLVVDRPFLFLIRHEATGATLFMGRVVNPQ